MALTGSGVRYQSPEVCSAHAQQEVAQYPALFTGSDVSHVTGRGPVRKCSCAQAQQEVVQQFPAFFSYSSSSTSTMATEGHPKGVRNRRVGATAGCATESWLQEVRVSRHFLV